ncbi:hypothetical protein TNIN_436721 [Trichonephila inaurata madagascariensis]|uniref:Uncharacterized protein n=1 Tax=Trichonephila inaurata madagascariensis TaxID=2747483 RepID=A0A8X7C7R9_9ARAC|nr:hypothetical protein TNIN_436721 [Trichonephila inaurata madagascariensis]
MPPCLLLLLVGQTGVKKENEGGEKIPKKTQRRKCMEGRPCQKWTREAFVMGAKCERKNDESRKLRPTPANDPPVSPSTHPCFSLGLPTDR